MNETWINNDVSLDMHTNMQANAYLKHTKHLDTQKIAVIILKLEKNRFITDELAQKM